MNEKKFEMASTYFYWQIIIHTLNHSFNNHHSISEVKQCRLHSIFYKNWAFHWYINHFKNLITQEETRVQNLYRFFRPTVYIIKKYIYT
jgi:hypothetical protein